MARYSNNTYQAVLRLDSENKRRYYDSILDPEIPRSMDDIYVVTSVGERLDLLAWKYYTDASLWWIIAAANTAEQASLITQPGIQLRIPANKEQAIQLYNRVNSRR